MRISNQEPILQLTGTVWTTQGDDAQRKYDYTYDNSGRVTRADFREYTTSSAGWSNAKMDFSVTGLNGKIEYDLNGNLKYMMHKGVMPGNSSPVNIDDLRYFYETLGNKLTKVKDESTLAQGSNGKFGDFTDGSNADNDDYAYDDNGNLVKDLNKDIKDLAGSANGIKYNYLDKPEEIRIIGKGTIKLVYDADGNKLQKIFTPENSNTDTVTSYINGFVYRGDELQYINFEEGRIRVMQTVTSDPNNAYDFLALDGNMDLPGGKRGAYDFFIRDHLGNVRMILTEETHTGRNTCTMELNRANNEETVFGQVDANGTPTGSNEVKARFPVDQIPGQTIGNGWQNNAIGNYVSRLGNLASKVGPNALLKVMAGDEISAEAFYYYQNAVANQPGGASFVSDILLSLAQAISGSPLTAGVTKSAASNITNQLSSSVPFRTIIDPDANDIGDNRPKAYLAILYFDERFNLVEEGSETKRVLQSGNGASPLVLPNRKAPKNGYALVYLCNESDEMVYFNNLQVTHNRGRIIEENLIMPMG
ncbi:hypothetical protein A4H97_10790 [Niastella yeongjuensis]|uniref:Uncharacterized protein n=1 Tax=Niastella yeongjuensis TaxID=354355 RepID=A0A1V9EFC9_9BACT|nr:hypothetical protein [Niastella yeongjuensis]OQP44838.1 hypothetical protein A4H97_10790 [Niastella yeongjuensis]